MAAQPLIPSLQSRGHDHLSYRIMPCSPTASLHCKATVDAAWDIVYLAGRRCDACFNAFFWCFLFVFAFCDVWYLVSEARRWKDSAFPRLSRVPGCKRSRTTRLQHASSLHTKLGM